LQNIEVDENNPNYCDVDGVLYNKDKTEILCYPCDHDEYLRQKYGYEKELYKDEVTPEYEKDIQTYVVPSTVVKLDEMCFNYANLRKIYLPEGLKKIETLAVFKLHEKVDQWGTTPSLTNIYSYKSDKVEDTHFVSEKSLTIDDKYLELASEQKTWYDEIIKYASAVDGSRRFKNARYEEYKVGKNRLVRMLIKRGIIVCEFILPNNDFKNYISENKLKIKAAPTVLKVLSEESVQVAKDSIDIAVKAIEEEKEYKKQQIRERRKQARLASK
jgi:hypothetical protein